MQKPTWCGSYAVGMDAFAPGVVGAKSKNLANLRGKLPEWIQLPPSMAVPFSTFDEVRHNKTRFSGIDWKIVSTYEPKQCSLIRLQ